MLAKQIKFSNFLVSSNKLAFKGFVIKKNDNILNVDYSVIKSQLPSSGSLQNFLLQPGTEYDTLDNIEYPSSVIKNKEFEIIVEFINEVEFDNIQCVCGDNEKNHFTNITIDYKTNNGSWFRFNRFGSVPIYSNNNIGSGHSTYLDIVTSNNVTRYPSDTIKTVYEPVSVLAGNSNNWDFIMKNERTFSTGKHFVEVTLKKSNRLTSSSSNDTIMLHESDTRYVLYTTGNGVKYYSVGFNQNGGYINRGTGTTETNIASNIGPGYHDSVEWPDMTIGFFVDLDNNKVKCVINGQHESAWVDIIKTKPNQEYYFVTKLRNMGTNAEFSVNYPHKFDYPDLTPEWNNKHFTATDGWKRSYAVTARKSSKETINRGYIEWPWTLLNHGVMNIDIQYVHKQSSYVWRVSEHDASQWGYGYFKNSVFIDYPPKEPTSKRVFLYSIKDNTMQQMTWSHPLTGEFEFKHVKMKQPYLIITYDSDEDFNGVVSGPVYPTLMPKYEGMDLTIQY